MLSHVDEFVRLHNWWICVFLIHIMIEVQPAFDDICQNLEFDLWTRVHQLIWIGVWFFWSQNLLTWLLWWSVVQNASLDMWLIMFFVYGHPLFLPFIESVIGCVRQLLCRTVSLPKHVSYRVDIGCPVSSKWLYITGVWKEILYIVSLCHLTTCIC